MHQVTIPTSQLKQTYDYEIPTKQMPPKPKRSTQAESLLAAMNEEAYVARVVVYEDTKLVSVQDHGTDRPNMLLGRTQPVMPSKPPLAERQPISISD